MVRFESELSVQSTSLTTSVPTAHVAKRRQESAIHRIVLSCPILSFTCARHHSWFLEGADGSLGGNLPRWPSNRPAVPVSHIAKRTSRHYHFQLGLFILVVLFLVTTARTQTLPPLSASDEVGMQAYQPYHGGDIDSVNLSTGTLSLDFPFLSYPQRGALHLSFNLMYNNQPQHYGQSCDNLGNCNYLWNYPRPFRQLPLETGDVFVGWAQQAQVFGQNIPVVFNAGIL